MRITKLISWTLNKRQEEKEKLEFIAIKEEALKTLMQENSLRHLKISKGWISPDIYFIDLYEHGCLDIKNRQIYIKLLYICEIQRDIKF